MNLIAATGTDFLDLHSSVKFVAGAYIFVLLVIVVYVGIMAKRLITNQRELSELRKLVEERDAEESVAGATGFGHGGTAATSAAAADDHERAAEAIRSEHQL
jgi:hypothetical protein